MAFGECSLELASRKAGPLVQSRWLTTASRILRLFVSTVIASPGLKILVQYVLKVYAPTCFVIKHLSGLEHGARHAWNTIQRSSFLPPDVRDVVRAVFSRNAFFLHPENLLISMLTDERQHVRELAARRIIKARNSPTNLKPHKASVRIFRPPEIVYDAEEYIDSIKWHTILITSPPVLRKVPNSVFESMIRDGVCPKWDFVKFPCHSQAVERCVKVVTEASAHVCGQERRDGFIRAKLLSRSIMPELSTKKDFNPPVYAE